MIIRKAISSDTPEIIEVLKSALGESLMPKSIGYWQWKHEQNPFGKSPVLIAEIDGKIVGVRAFLPWAWQENKKEWKSVRAVDTAVLPDFQGMGIFSKLTKRMLDDCLTQQYDFVFNTPNKNSLPGYLKMGWKKTGRLPVQFYLSSLPTKKANLNLKEIDDTEFKIISERASSLTDKLHTKIFPEYLIWRYQQCPVANYQFFTDQESYLLIYRIKDSKFGREMRVADVFGLDGKKTIDKNSLKLQLKNISRETDVNYISYLQSGNSPDIFSGFLKTPSLRIGPLLTIKNISMGDSFTHLFSRNNWGYSLGDLEIF